MADPEANENGQARRRPSGSWNRICSDGSDPATVIAMYLHPRTLLQPMPKLKRLRPGTRIVSHYYHMGEEWPPDESKDINSLMIYLWIVR